MLLTQKTDKTIKSTIDNDYNVGFYYRHKRFKGAQKVQMCGKLHCDIFNTNRYMLSNVNIQVVLLKAPANFYLLADKSATNLSILTSLIDDIFLKVRKCVISPSIMLAHAMALEKTTAKYPIKRVLMKDIVIPYESKRFVLQGFHTGVMSTRIVMGFLNNVAASGSYELNPLNSIIVN